MEPKDLKGMVIKRLKGKYDCYISDGVKRYFFEHLGSRIRCYKLIRFLSLMPKDTQVFARDIKRYLSGKVGNESDPEDFIDYVVPADKKFITPVHDLKGDQDD